MRTVQIVFSPTGGTGKVSAILAKALGESTETIDLTKANAGLSAIHLQESDLALISVPVFGGRVPSLAGERLGGLKGAGARCVVAAVYGNRAYDNALAELASLAEGAGFKVIAAIAAIAEHSIIREYAAGRPDQEDEAQLRSFAAEIAEKYQSSAARRPLSVPGSLPEKPAGSMTLVPKANAECTGCGLCAEKCPAQAISRDHLKSASKEKCISCMRCVSVCPQSARKASPLMVSAAALAIRKACSVRKENELFL